MITHDYGSFGVKHDQLDQIKWTMILDVLLD